MRQAPESEIEELIAAARSVVSDVISMSADGEFFGPFSEGRAGFGRDGEAYFVEWPNLAITIARLEKVVKAIERSA